MRVRFIAGNVLFVALVLVSHPDGLSAGTRVQRTDEVPEKAQRLVADADQLALQYRLESSRAALNKYQSALPLLVADVAVARTMIRIANVYRTLGNLTESVKYLEMAVMKAQSSQDKLLEMEALVALGTAQLRQGNTSKAKETLS